MKSRHNTYSLHFPIHFIIYFQTASAISTPKQKFLHYFTISGAAWQIPKIYRIFPCCHQTIPTEQTKQIPTLRQSVSIMRRSISTFSPQFPPPSLSQKCPGFKMPAWPLFSRACVFPFWQIPIPPPKFPRRAINSQTEPQIPGPVRPPCRAKINLKPNCVSLLGLENWGAGRQAGRVSGDVRWTIDTKKSDPSRDV